MADGVPDKSAPGPTAPRRTLGRADQPDRVRAMPGVVPGRRVPRADAEGEGHGPVPVKPIVVPPRSGPSTRPVRPVPAGAPVVPIRVPPTPRADVESSAPEDRVVEPVVEPVVEAFPARTDPASSRAFPSTLATAPGSSDALPSAAAVELARAFHASAEALQGIHRLHADLAQSMRRADRSELVLQSTNALNETFRNLATVQRELLKRLDAPPSTAQRMLPLMIIGLLVVFVGGIAAVVHLVDTVRDERPDPFAVAHEMEASRKRGAEEASASAERELTRRQKDLEDLASRLGVIQSRADERERELLDLQGEARTLESQRDELATEALRLRSEGTARRVVEDELRLTTQKLAVLEPRLQQIEMDLQAERVEKQRLQALIAEARMGLTELAPAESAVPPPAAGVEPKASGLKVSRDTRQIEAIRTTVNRFLEAAGKGRTEYWQLAGARGVSGDRLHDVQVLHYDPRGRLLDAVEAEDLVMTVDRTSRKVTFDFRNGNVIFDKTRTPFQDGVLSKVVAEGEEAVRLWTGSGLLILRTR